jgi:hypothetical protein
LCRLNELGFVWYSLNEQWEQGFSLLSAFKQREGHCLVTQKHIEDGLKLGIWVSKQRSTKSTLSEERISRLNELGFVWDPLNEQWEQGFSLLSKFKQREGHCLVPNNHFEDGFKLGKWLDRQRSTESTLSEERLSRLNELGFVWDPFNDQWEQGFSLLSAFKQREGHCLVPYKHLEHGFRLGHWVSRHRSNKLTLSGERLNRLTNLGFVWSAKKNI